MTEELSALFSAGAEAGRTLHSDGNTLWLALPGEAGDLESRCAATAGDVLSAARSSHWPELTRLLGLDFTLLVRMGRDLRTLLVRGPFSRTPLYVSVTNRATPLATQLWTQAGANPAPDFLPHLLANACLPCPVECDHTLMTAAAGWQRVPRASVVEYRDGRMSGPTGFGLPRYPRDATLSRTELEETLRSAVDDRIAFLARGMNAAAELSGGIDSGIVVARAREVLEQRFLGGVSIVTPYAELRRESAFIDATAAHAGVSTLRIEVERHLPFARLSAAPLHDEPSISSLPWALMAGSLEAAHALGARVHLHGIGGDQVFAPPPKRFAALESRSLPLPFVAWRARSAFGRARREVRRRYFAGSRLRFAEEGTLLYDGWIDRYVAPAGGIRYEGVYLDPRIIRLCEALRAHDQSGGASKAIARRAFRADLAPEVLARRGKVGFDGVYQRGLRKHLDEVVGLIEQASLSLERMHLRPAHVVSGLERCARRGWGSEATPLFAVLAWAVWRHVLRREGLSA